MNLGACDVCVCVCVCVSWRRLVRQKKNPQFVHFPIEIKMDAVSSLSSFPLCPFSFVSAGRGLGSLDDASAAARIRESAARSQISLAGMSKVLRSIGNKGREYLIEGLPSSYRRKYMLAYLSRRGGCHRDVAVRRLWRRLPAPLRLSLVGRVRIWPRRKELGKEGVGFGRKLRRKESRVSQGRSSAALTTITSSLTSFASLATKGSMARSYPPSIALIGSVKSKGVSLPRGMGCASKEPTSQLFGFDLEQVHPSHPGHERRRFFAFFRFLNLELVQGFLLG